MATGTVAVNSKKCARCGEERPVAQYHKKSSAPDGLQPWCKPCIYDYDKQPKKGEKTPASKTVDINPPKSESTDVPPVVETPTPAVAEATVTIEKQPSTAGDLIRHAGTAPGLSDDDDDDEPSRDEAVDWLINELKKSREELGEASAERDRWRAQVDSSQGEIIGLREQSAKLENIVNGLTDELNTLRAEYDKERAKLQADVDEALRLYDEAASKLKVFEDAAAAKAKKKAEEGKLTSDQKDELSLLGFNRRKK